MRANVSYALTTTVRRPFADTLVATRASGLDTTLVEALDPKIMVTLTHNDALSSVAEEAGQRLAAALDSLSPVGTDRGLAPHAAQ